LNSSPPFFKEGNTRGGLKKRRYKIYEGKIPQSGTRKKAMTMV
jgi:hypothetical protein